MHPSIRRALAGLAASAAVTGCGSSTAADPTPAEEVQVVAGFYPLQFVADRVGADLVSVASLTAPGVEPHDLELTPREVAAVGEADLVLYLEGFQPAVDEAVQQQAAADSPLEVGAVAGLDLAAPADSPAEGAGEDDHAGKPEPTADPHFWLDPTKVAAVGQAVAERLAEVDPDNAATYRGNASALTDELTALDEELRAGLASCADRRLVVSHEAFGYLAARYDLEQVGIAGLSPEDEPSPAQMAELAGFVADTGIRTVYHETLTPPEIAETIAAEAGVRTSVLDPVEGITDSSAGTDYLQVMRANLASLREGQPCP